MNQWLRQLALCFAAGAAGGLVKTLVAWSCARYGWDAHFATHFPSVLRHALVYARVVWGGLWALLFLLPVARGAWWQAGLLWGLVVTVVQWLVLPLLSHGALHLAALPVLWALLLNFVWGLVTALLLRLMR